MAQIEAHDLVIISACMMIYVDIVGVDVRDGRNNGIRRILREAQILLAT